MTNPDASHESLLVYGVHPPQTALGKQIYYWSGSSYTSLTGPNPTGQHSHLDKDLDTGIHFECGTDSINPMQTAGQEWMRIDAKDGSVLELESSGFCNLTNLRPFIIRQSFIAVPIGQTYWILTRVKFSPGSIELPLLPLKICLPQL